MKKNYVKGIKYISLIAVIALVVYFLNRLDVFKSYSSKDIKLFLDSLGMLAPIVYIVLFTFVPLTFFPDSVLAIAGGMAFGLIKGSLLTIIGALCGGTLAFFIARYLGQDVIKRFIKKDISILGKHTQEKGFWAILVLRLIPLVPFDVISYSAGLSEVKYKDFLLATLLGIIPGVMVFSNIGDKSLEIGSFQFYISIALLIILLVVSALFKKKISQRIIGDINKPGEENL
ncbi:SNARE-like domain protein [Clostridiales bacterium oral taxon 876 str. F0540]|nr:SNARE-like domain protein [Clostridiales bacterium oral taxon 876 str. F0540]